MIERRPTRKIKIKNIYVGGDSKISVQSMTNTDTRSYIRPDKSFDGGRV